MGKGFGIAALVLAVLAIFVPLYGVVVSAVAVLLATVAVFGNDRIFSTAVAILSAVNALFLSPSFWIFVVGNDVSHQGQAAPFLIVLYCTLPFLAMGGIAVYQRGGLGAVPMFNQPGEWQQSTTNGSAGAASAPRSPAYSSPQEQAKPYDRRKWLALIRFDDEIRAAAAKVRPLGEAWEDELARMYLQLNDKGSLERIVQLVFERSRRP